MEKDNLLIKLNTLLPSVEGEDDTKITAAKLREVFLDAYSAGVKDAFNDSRVNMPENEMQNSNNKFIGVSELTQSPGMLGNEYDRETRVMKPDDISIYKAGMSLKIFDTDSHISVDTVIESVNESEGTMVLTTNELSSGMSDNYQIYSKII